MTIRYKFATALYHARREKHLTQEETAELLDVSTRWFQKIENAHSEPNLELTCKIVKEFGIRLEDCLEDSNANLQTQGGFTNKRR